MLRLPSRFAEASSKKTVKDVALYRFNMCNSNLARCSDKTKVRMSKSENQIELHVRFGDLYRINRTERFSRSLINIPVCAKSTYLHLKLFMGST